MLKKLKVVALVIVLILIAVDIKIMFLDPGVSRKPASVKLNSIVRLVRDGRTFCSGTVVNPRLIITAAHCTLVESLLGMMPNPEPIEIRASDNVARGTTAMVVFAGSQMDQAVLYGDFSLFEVRPAITDPTALTNIRNTKNMAFITCGYPLYGPLYCTVTTFDHPEDFMWAVKGVLLPGMSGGPTMLPDGTVVAVNSAVFQEYSIVTPIYNLTSQALEAMRK